MKIGVANRDGIVDRLNLGELRAAGVGSIEIYSAPDNPKLPERVQKLVDEGFEPVVHLGGVLKIPAIQVFLENTQKFETLRRVVVHPVEQYEIREDNEEKTVELCYELAKLSHKMFSLENLPFDPAVPQRFGDNLGDIFTVARRTGITNCFDTGHYFSGSLDSNFKPLSVCRSRLIKHIHVHAYVHGEDHHPLQNDRKGDLRRLIEKFRYCCPWYEGVFSIEIIPFGLSDHDAVYGSIEYLKYHLRKD